MRYYLPLQEKGRKGKRHASSLALPLWVWMLLIAVCLLFVLALR